MKYNCYTPNEHDERWSHGDDIDGAASDAVDDRFYDLSIPWLNRNTAKDWEPSKGMIISIGAGVKDPIKWPEIAPDLVGHMKDRMHELIGEAAESFELPDDLQEKFETWMHSITGSANTSHYRVEDITTIDVVFDGDGWVEVDL